MPTEATSRRVRTYQPFVASDEHCVQHGLVDEEVAHPLGDDDVNLGHGELNLLHLSSDQGDLALQ